jgi:hypothetical protein
MALLGGGWVLVGLEWPVDVSSAVTVSKSKQEIE